MEISVRVGPSGDINRTRQGIGPVSEPVKFREQR